MADVDEILAKLPVYPVLAELRACLCASLEEETCYCGLLVGAEIPLELSTVDGVCDSATAYVRLVGASVSTSFPVVDTGADEGFGRRVYAIAVGVVRAAPIGSSHETPSAEDEDVFARRLLADQDVMFRAIRCCINEDKFDDVRIAALSYLPMERSGGVGGGEWTFQLQV